VLELFLSIPPPYSLYLSTPHSQKDKKKIYLLKLLYSNLAYPEKKKRIKLFLHPPQIIFFGLLVHTEKAKFIPHTHKRAQTSQKRGMRC